MPFDITTERTFAASHQIWLYDGQLEPLHGHNWVVRVTVSAAKLDRIGVVMDFHDLERQLNEIVGGWHNRHLNDVQPFTGPGALNPTAEHVAFHVGRSLKLPDGVTVRSVEVLEAPGCWAVYRP
jgi:6-pyruvoyltetrahydropterin/6-carboxytetrahydropterin synthase